MTTIPVSVNGAREKTPVSAQRSATGAEPSSPIAALVRRHDRDRYQTALFAPAARRGALFALYAFNHEIARVRERVTQPTLGHIRLEWWRENIAALYDGGPLRHHPVVAALAPVIREHRLTRACFDRLIDAREADFDAEAPATLADLEDYAEGTSSPVILLALEILGVSEPAAAESGREIGIAYALAGLLRALPILSASGRPIIPTDLAKRAGFDAEKVLAHRASPRLKAAIAEIAQAARGHLGAARAMGRTIPRGATSALLPAIVAGHWLKRLEHARYDPFAPALARPDPLQIWRLAIAALHGRF
jgi:NADH dehydrogenase [ubiquinone] 1 alpha subcomplex assembly factor 6